jgi:hypothetical protein
MREQPLPQAHLAPDAGIEQQRLALAADLSVDAKSPDAELLMPDGHGHRGVSHRKPSLGQVRGWETSAPLLRHMTLSIVRKPRNRELEGPLTW